MPRARRFSVLAFVLVPMFLVAASGSARSAEALLKAEVRVEAGKAARRQTPVRATIFLPANEKPGEVVLTDAQGKRVPASLAAPALLDPVAAAPANQQPFTLTFLLPELAAGQTAVYTATVARGESSTSGPFEWKAVEGEHLDLMRDGRPMVRYMMAAYVYDKDDANKRDLNNKPFHHLFDPAGKRLVTKGSGGFYTHHQGLFYGFTRCTLSDGSKQNLWYCHEGEHMSHLGSREQIANAVFARHQTEIDWNDTKGKPFCRERRELAAYNVPGGTLVEWSSQLKSVRGEVVLDGDPQHAGFQFRAANEVNDRLKEKLTTYLRVDGRGKPGETRNWPQDQQMTNLPWNAMSFVLGDQRYTAVYIDSPRNPKPSFYSERDYGRFGSWFGKQTLTEGGPTVDITYRIWLQEGEMSVEQAEAVARDFAEPPKATVVVK